MKNALKTGLGFGVTSGIITTLGLIIGLYSGTQSRLAVIVGVLTIAIADACADSLGIHIAEEAKNSTSQKYVWLVTGITFFTKFFIALTFLIPFFFWSFHVALGVTIVWAIFILGILSYYVAKERGVPAWHVILEHELIAFAVMVVSHYVPAYLQIWLV